MGVLLEVGMVAHQLEELVLVLRVHHQTLLEEAAELVEPGVVLLRITLHLILQHLEDATSDDIS